MKKKVNRAGRAFTIKHPGKYRALQNRYKALLEENKSLLEENESLLEENESLLEENESLLEENGILYRENVLLKFILFCDTGKSFEAFLEDISNIEVVMADFDEDCLEEVEAPSAGDTTRQDAVEQQGDAEDYIAFEYKGYQCRILKQSWSGKENYFLMGMDSYSTSYYCGYVAVPKEHPFCQKNRLDLALSLSVHRGITFSQMITPKSQILNDLEGEFVIGFDCKHFGDTIEKCNAEYVRKELELLVDQLIKADEK